MCPHPQAQKLKKSPGEIGLIQVVFKWLPLSELLLLTKFPGWDEENLTIPYHPTEEGEVIILFACSLCATNIKFRRRKVWANRITHIFLTKLIQRLSSAGLFLLIPRVASLDTKSVSVLLLKTALSLI